MECAYCGVEFEKSKHNQKYCCTEHQNKANLKNWHSRNKDKVREYREKTKEQRNARRRELYAKDASLRKEIRAKVKEWQEKNPRKRKEHRLKKYGITIEEFETILASQGNSCAICGHSDTSDKNFFPVVDHCHDTGNVRGILCMNCNMGIGKLKDSPEIIKSALRYIKCAKKY